jgi:hypothetical protein
MAPRGLSLVLAKPGAYGTEQDMSCVSMNYLPQIKGKVLSKSQFLMTLLSSRYSQTGPQHKSQAMYVNLS